MKRTYAQVEKDNSFHFGNSSKEGKGSISHQQAQQKAFEEYEAFNKSQKIESDFDREIKKIVSQ